MNESRVDVAAIRAALAKATPGPWVADTDTRGDCVVWGPNGQFVQNAEAEPHWLPAADGGKRAASFDVDRGDAELIVLLRNSAEALLACAEVLQPLAGPAILHKGEYVVNAASITYADRQKEREAEAERRGAVKALREARNAFLYPHTNEPYARWMKARADAIENGADL